MTLHPNLDQLAALIGTWAGQGHGEYPTIASFDYREEISFVDIGKPFLVYTQRTWATTDGRPMHTETGYLRAPEPGRVEFVLAQPTGQTESGEGTLTSTDDELLLEFEAVVTNTSSAKQVDATARRYRLAGDQLSTSFDMAAVGQPMVRHLTAELTRQ